MLSYNMNERGDLPLYEYLYRRIRDDIVSGAIAADEHLPSKRNLAAGLGVSLITVQSAYAQLIAEGYVVARQRRGYYAAELPGALPSRKAPLPPENVTAGGMPAQGDTAGATHDGPSSAVSATRDCPGRCGLPSPAGYKLPKQPLIADFSRATPAERPPAATLWSRALRDALAHEPESELFGPQPPQGNLRLRTAIARHLRGATGMEVSPHRIVIGAGAQVLYVLVAQLLGTDRVFAVEDPGYPQLTGVYASCGAAVRHMPMDREGIDMQALRSSDATIVHVMPSHQFPTGRVTSIARRYELLGWAAHEPARYIVEDDYDREFRLAGMPIPPLAGIDTQQRVLYISTFSKSLSAALRMAYLVLPEALAVRFERELGFYASTVSAIDQVTLARLFESGEYERHVNRYRKRQRDVRDALLEAIHASALGPVSLVEEADSGLHFVLALDVAPTEGEIARRAAAEGVLLAPLSRYLHDPGNARTADGRKRFVMQYEGLDVANAPQAVAAIERACDLEDAG